MLTELYVYPNLEKERKISEIDDDNERKVLQFHSERHVDFFKRDIASVIMMIDFLIQRFWVVLASTIFVGFVNVVVWFCV